MPLKRKAAANEEATVLWQLDPNTTKAAAGDTISVRRNVEQDRSRRNVEQDRRQRTSESSSASEHSQTDDEEGEEDEDSKGSNASTDSDADRCIMCSQPADDEATCAACANCDGGAPFCNGCANELTGCHCGESERFCRGHLASAIDMGDLLECTAEASAHCRKYVSECCEDLVWQCTECKKTLCIACMDHVGFECCSGMEETMYNEAGQPMNCCDAEWCGNCKAAGAPCPECGRSCKSALQNYEYEL